MKRTGLILRWLLVVLASLLLAGCAGNSDLVRHGFAFDFIDDSHDAELIEYRYGTSAYGRSERVRQGRTSQQWSVFGEIRRGDDLYVKWKLKATGEVFEQTIDLKDRLPADIEDCRVYFLVRGLQLYVYLITPRKRAKDEPPNGPDKWAFRHVLTIYPDQSAR